MALKRVGNPNFSIHLSYGHELSRIAHCVVEFGAGSNFKIKPYWVFSGIDAADVFFTRNQTTR
jgi:hypothetical protein